MTAQVRGVPYRRVAAHHVSHEPWQSQTGGKAGPLGLELPHWDYNVDLRLIRSLTVLEEDVRADCRLTPRDLVSVAVVWRAGGSIVRGCSSLIPLGNSRELREITLNAEIAGHLLASSVQISTQILLTEEGQSRDPLAPRYPGSILWEDTTTVLLEGSGSRFPMEVVDFNGVNWAPYGAAWYLTWRPDNLHLPFLRNVRLFINASNPAVLAAVRSTEPNREHALIRSAIYCDVARQLLRGALSNEDFVENPDSFLEGSTGLAVLRLVKGFFPGERPAGLRNTMLSRPEHFDGQLQGTFRLFLDGQ